nr:hypothetical protein [Tanacetum cinerariifolium]
MSSAFADTHNMVTILAKSDASEGFDQIIDFLNGSYIQYALNVNPHIYISCIKQIWNTATVKQSTDVTRLQALVDKKKVVISEAIIRKVLQLDDAKGMDCLPNEEIFTRLARMGYEKPSTKLTFYKAFFLSRKFNFSKYIFDSLVINVDSSSKFYMYPRIGKGFSGVETPLFEGMPVVREDVEADIREEQIPDDTAIAAAQETVLDACAALTLRVEHLEHAKEAQKLKKWVKKLERVTKVKTFKLRRLKKVETSQRVETSDDTIIKDVSNQGRMIVELDKNEGVELIGEKEKTKEVKDILNNAQVEGRQAEKQAEIYQIDLDHPSKVLSIHEDDSEVQEAVEVVTTAKLITKVVNAASTPVSVASTIIPTAKQIILAAEPNIPAVTITAALVKVVVASTRRRRGMVIRYPEKESSAKTSDETKSKDKGKGILVEEPKPMKKKEQVEMDEAYTRKLHEELNQDIDWDIAIEHSKEKIEEEESRAFESINETSAQKAAKKRRLNQEDKDVEEIKQHLEIVPDEDDDVYTEATPLSRKVPVVDYHIILLNNKPRYKIIKADGTHQLYASFITLLKNFDRDELETLWSIVKERFSTSKPNNFSDEYLLTTLRTMFGRPDGQDNVWKSQRSVHG